MAKSNHVLTRRHAFSTAEVFAWLLLLVVVWFAGKILLITFAGLLLAVFLNALAGTISRSTPLSYGWALALVVLFFVALAGIVAWLVGSLLVSQVSEFLQAVPRSLKQIRSNLEEYELGQWVLEQSPDLGKAIAQGSIPSRVTDLASAIIDFALAGLIMIFVGLYCAAEPEVYIEGLLRLVPLDKRGRAKEVLAALGYNLRWWLLAQIFAMVCVGLVTGIGMRIAGVPFALVLGLLAATLEIIPTVGPVLWLVPASLVAWTQGSSQVVNVVIIYTVTQMIESYILIPMVQRRAVRLPPTLSILAVVLLGLLAGVLGLLVAAPLALVVMVLVKMLYVQDRLGDRDVEVPGGPPR